MADNTNPDAESENPTPEPAPAGSAPAPTTPASSTPEPAEDPALTWFSGDWREPADVGAEPPYNGLELVATPTYSQDEQLSSVSVLILDYTNSKDGAGVTVTFQPVVPGKAIPVRPSPTPKKPGEEATVRGSLELKDSGEVFFLILWTDLLKYGLPDEEHHVEGGLLKIPRLGFPTPDPPAPAPPTPDPPAPPAPDPPTPDKPTDSPDMSQVVSSLQQINSTLDKIANVLAANSAAK